MIPQILHQSWDFITFWLHLHVLHEAALFLNLCHLGPGDLHELSEPPNGTNATQRMCLAWLFACFLENTSLF